MPDIPKQAATDLNARMRKVLKASHAVREGIATHAEKHTAIKHRRRAELEASRKLTEQGR